jgi:Flp pilus assembly protein TadD
VPARREDKIQNTRAGASTGRAPSTGAPHRPTALLGAIAALVAVALYLPALDFGWVWDDQVLVATQGMGGVAALGVRPIAALLYRLEWALGLGAPLLFHLTSILLHGLATWLVFRLALSVGAGAWIAFASSLLFAAHPVHVEAVAYVSGRPALLATVFSLGALLLARPPDLSDSEGSRSWKIWPAYAAMAAAVLCEETAVVTPLVLIALDRWGPVRVPWRGRLVLYSGFAAIAVVYLLVRMAGPGHVGAGADSPMALPASLPPVAGSSPSANGIAPEARGWALPIAAGTSLRVLAMPYRLVAMRTLTAERAASSEARASAFLAMALLALWIAWRRTDPVGRAGAVLLVLPLLPALPIPGAVGAYVEDRSLYYASVGFCLLVGSVCGWLRSLLPAAVTAAFAGIAVCLAAAGTVTHLPVWRSNTALLQASVAADPADPAPHLALARIAAAEENWASALDETNRAIAVDPENAPAVQMRTAILSRMNRWEESAASAREAIALDPKDAVSWANLGDALNQQGKTAEAVDACRRAVTIDSALVSGWYNLGVALGTAGDPAGAAAAYEKAVALQPNNVLALNNLAAIYGSTGRLAEARDLYIRVVGLAPNSIEGRMNLALVYLRLGDRARAAEERETVRRLNPSAVRRLDEILKASLPPGLDGQR